MSEWRKRRKLLHRWSSAGSWVSIGSYLQNYLFRSADPQSQLRSSSSSHGSYGLASVSSLMMAGPAALPRNIWMYYIYISLVNQHFLSDGGWSVSLVSVRKLLLFSYCRLPADWLKYGSRPLMSVLMSYTRRLLCTKPADRETLVRPRSSDSFKVS